jgi:1-aminocyclopropane-1-carboxylate deaminase/D-cysteine desulfhydrase-like pyridoxal-dependent ACC family enzyme
MKSRALQKLTAIARQQFGFYPTPLEELGRLRVELGARAPRLLIKRDDYTGFALGGNKVRKLEYELAPERVRDAHVIVTSGGIGSNHARVTAAAAARLGVRCILVLNGTPHDPPRGNALLQRLFGAEVVHVGSRQERAARVEEVAQQLRADGQNVVVVPLGASTPQGALGYVRAADELGEQLRTVQLDGGHLWIFVSASSSGTLAGLIVGLQLADLEHVRLVGVSPDDSSAEIRSTARSIAEGTADILGYELSLSDHSPIITDDYVGDGYGIPTRESEEAITLFAQTEGVVLDPVYSAKTAAAMIDWTRRGNFTPHDTVIFWHTGGWPAIFAK